MARSRLRGNALLEAARPSGKSSKVDRRGALRAGPQPGSDEARRARAAARLREAPQEVRLIGGRWRRSKLPVLEADGLRPTPDRVRETLFNWLGQDLSGWQAADVFAGTGALGLEAASRGAAQVVLVERDPRAVAGLAQSVARLKAEDCVSVRSGDGLAWLQGCAPASLDVVFLDPPFEAPALMTAALQAAVRAVRPGGAVYAESASAELPLPAGLLPHRHLAAGAVHAHLLRVAPPSETPAGD